MNKAFQSFGALPSNNNSNYFYFDCYEKEYFFFQNITEDIYDNEIAKKYNGNIWREDYFSYLDKEIRRKILLANFRRIKL